MRRLCLAATPFVLAAREFRAGLRTIATLAVARIAGPP
jgi:hypothetical protein